MPIYTIDVNTGAGPTPTNLTEVWLRMFEILLQNSMEADMKTSRKLRALHQGPEGDREEQVRPGGCGDPEESRLEEGHGIRPSPASACDRHEETGGDSPSDFAPESIERRVAEGHEQMCAHL